jgi:hypothetical protein
VHRAETSVSIKPAEEALDGASRLRDIGHGGQILVTSAVANALDDARSRPSGPPARPCCAPRASSSKPGAEISVVAACGGI